MGHVVVLTDSSRISGVADYVNVHGNKANRMACVDGFPVRHRISGGRDSMTYHLDCWNLAGRPDFDAAVARGVSPFEYFDCLTTCGVPIPRPAAPDWLRVARETRSILSFCEAIGNLRPSIIRKNTREFLSSVSNLADVSRIKERCDLAEGEGSETIDLDGVMLDTRTTTRWLFDRLVLRNT